MFLSLHKLKYTSSHLVILIINDARTVGSGKPGAGQAKVDQFFAEATAFSDWWKKAEGNAMVLPLGLNTEAAAAAVKTVKSKVDDYFTCGWAVNAKAKMNVPFGGALTGVPTLPPGSQVVATDQYAEKRASIRK